MTAGTPLPFLAGEWPPESLAVLEFSDVLELVAGYAAGAEAAARIRARRPATDEAVIRADLADVAEAAALERGGEGLVVPAAPAAGPVLDRLSVAGSVLDPGELLVLRHLLACARTTLAELRRVAEEAPRIATLRVPLPDAALGRRLDASLDDDGQLLDSASPALASARRAVHKVRARLLDKLESMLRGLDAAGAPTIRNGRYVIPVRRDQRQRPAGIVHDESSSQGTLFIEPTAAIDLGNALREAEVGEERAVLEVLRDVTELARPEAGVLAGCLEMCVAADELRARAAYAAAVDGHAPTVGRDETLTIDRGRHPLLLGEGGGDVVAFDLALARDEHTIVVSGPNTGGKTVLLKAVGLVCAMAQSGMIPPLGAGSRLPVIRRCFADIGDHQSITASLSTFSAHIQALRTILEEADGDTLVLIDEMGSGTDPAEGAALASAALATLTRRGATTIATTHLGVLKELPDRVPGVVNASLEFDPASLRPTYRFRKGVPGRSYGLAIGRRLGLADELLQEAEAGLPEANRRLDALLASVEEREHAVREEAARLAADAADLARRAAVVAKREEDTTALAETLEAREREAEREGRRRAKAYLLEARRRVEGALGLARAAVNEATAREARRLVEEGVRAESDALAEMEEGEEAAPTVDAPVTVGSRVRLTSGLEGTVVERRGDGRWVVAAGAVQTAVREADIAGVLAERAAPRRVAGTGAGAALAAEAEAPHEIDLRGLTGDEAEAATIRAIDDAVLAGQPSLRIIHGMGTGVVRARVRRAVEGDARVGHAAYAAPRDGGTGVTVVEIRA